MKIFPQLVEDYPAHFIDFLPEYQRKGFGRQLMDMFCGRVETRGREGGSFSYGCGEYGWEVYDWVGFGRFPSVLDGGKSREKGRHPAGIWLVRNLA